MPEGASGVYRFGPFALDVADRSLKRGDRFAGDVTRETAIENSIAVMPFTDMSAGRDQEFFCEGMSEEIINALGRVPELRVSSYTSSLRFKGKAIDTETIGRELKVAWLLEGSVRKAGEVVRIAVQLVRADD